VRGIEVLDTAHNLKARCLNQEISDFLRSPYRCFSPNGKPVISHPLILAVFPSSPAQQLGLRPGDIIEAYDGKPVSGEMELVDRIPQSGDEKHRLDVIRHGQPLVFMVPSGKLGMEFGQTFVPASRSASSERASE